MNKPNKRVLWIDDEAHILRYYVEYLELDKIEVKFCLDKKEITSFLKQKFDLVILDIMVFSNPTQSVETHQSLVDNMRKGLDDFLPLIVSNNRKFIIFSNLPTESFLIQYEQEIRRAKELYLGYYYKPMTNPERLSEIINNID